MSNYIVFDSETVNDAEAGGFRPYGNQIFDFGLIVANADGEIILEYNRLVEEVFSNKPLMAKSFFGLEYVENYEQMVKNDKVKVVPAKEIAMDVRAIVKRFEPKIIYAYNAGFDEKATIEMGQKHDTGIIFNFDEIELGDIYHMACQALAGNESYATFAIEHDFVTDKGNIKASAEAVYAFIKNDKNFIEDHTALSDSIIENEILNWVFKKEPFPGFFNKGKNGASWRLIQSKEK